ncbi:MAG: choice-of-anchor A family protein [Candidatus Pristimantibacillus sp.]
MKKSLKSSFLVCLSFLVIFGAGINVIAQASASNGSSNILGTAGEYNLFILGSMNLSNTDAEGRVAVGGSATVSNYTVNSEEVAGTNAFVVGGSLQYTNGEIRGGNLVTGGAIASSGMTLTNGSKPQLGTPIDFTAESSYLQGVSADLAALPSNGTTTEQYGTITLTGTDPNTNVFTIDRDFGELLINVPDNSTIIINVLGSQRNIGTASIFYKSKGNGALHEDTLPNVVRSILFNFPDAEKIDIGSSGLRGSLLAPKAAVSTTYSNIAGNIITATLSGHVEGHFFPFNGTVTPPTQPSPSPSPEPTPTETEPPTPSPTTPTETEPPTPSPTTPTETEPPTPSPTTPTETEPPTPSPTTPTETEPPTPSPTTPTETEPPTPSPTVPTETEPPTPSPTVPTETTSPIPGPVTTPPGTTIPTPSPTSTPDEIIEITPDPTPLGPVDEELIDETIPTGATDEETNEVVEPTPSPVPTDEEIVVVDETIPLGTVEVDTLPKTGENSHMPYYIAGLLLAIAGFMIQFRHHKN